MKNIWLVLLMYIAFFIYSISGVFFKFASGFTFLSLPYIFCYGGGIFVIGIYALLWQQVLKHIPLSVAMASKSVCLIFSIIWAVVLFNEKIDVKAFCGIVLVLCGILIIGR